MKKFEVLICTPSGDFHVIIEARNQRDAEHQAYAIAEAEGGRFGGGHYARQVG